MNESEIEEAGRKFGQALKKRIAETDIDHACSDIIANGIVSWFSELNKKLNATTSEIKKDKATMIYWLNAKYRVQMLLNAMLELTTPDPTLIYESKLIDKNHFEDLPKLIGTDFEVFSIWCILHGADSDSVRRLLTSREMIELSKREKERGSDFFLTFLERACIAYISAADKVIKPAYEQMIQSENEKPINSSLFDALKTFAKPSTTPSPSPSTKPSTTDTKSPRTKRQSFVSFEDMVNAMKK